MGLIPFGISGVSLMVVTNEWIDKFKTVRGGWTKRQLAAIGVPWPPQKGWKFRAVGKHITVVQRATFELEAHQSRMRADVLPY